MPAVGGFDHQATRRKPRAFTSRDRQGRSRSMPASQSAGRDDEAPGHIALRAQFVRGADVFQRKRVLYRQGERSSSEQCCSGHRSLGQVRRLERDLRAVLRCCGIRDRHHFRNGNSDRRQLLDNSRAGKVECYLHAVRCESRDPPGRAGTIARRDRSQRAKIGVLRLAGDADHADAGGFGDRRRARG